MLHHQKMHPAEFKAREAKFAQRNRTVGQHDGSVNSSGRVICNLSLYVHSVAMWLPGNLLVILLASHVEESVTFGAQVLNSYSMLLQYDRTVVSNILSASNRMKLLHTFPWLKLQQYYIFSKPNLKHIKWLGSIWSIYDI